MAVIVRRVSSETYDVSFRQYLDIYAPYVMTDPSFQANDEDGRWTPEEQSSFLTSVVSNMAPSKFIFAEVDSCLEYHNEEKNATDISYYEFWKKRGARFLNVDSHNRDKTLKDFTPADIQSLEDGFASIEHAKYIIKGVGDWTITDGNDTWATMKQDLKDFILDNCFVTIQTYTDCTRSELSELAIRVNKGKAWNDPEKRNTSTSTTATVYRDLATKWKHFFKEDGCEYFNKTQLVRRGVDDFFADLGCVSFYGMSQTITHSTKNQMYCIGSDHEKEVRSIGRRIDKFMKLLDTDMYAIPDKLSLFDLWVLFDEVDKKGFFIPEENKKKMITDYIKVVGDLMNDSTPIEIIVKGKLQTKTFDVLIGGLQKTHVNKRNELITDKFNIFDYAKEYGKRTQTARGKFKSAASQNYVTPEGKIINKERLHTSDFHNGHVTPYADGGDEFKIQEAKDNLTLGRNPIINLENGVEVDTQ